MLIRVTEPGRPAFRLRKGEEGISAFDSESVAPPLTEAEVLDGFRPGSIAVVRSIEAVEKVSLRVLPIEGGPSLPERLRRAHIEIRPGVRMTREQFKLTLKGLEDGD